MKKRTDNFEKFLPGKKGAAIKEQFRQEKKKWKKDRAEAFELKKKREIEIAQKITPAPFVIKKKMTGEPLPLNKFIAHCGVSGRREAAMIVRKGEITVNGEVITEPGHKVTETDEVLHNGKKLHLAKNLVYILLNKPKDYLTTLSDPEGRKTVMDLIKKAGADRVYPVGRLDRNTTGVLLLTNDGELTQKLSHPSNEIKKIYEVKLDKPLAKADMEAIAIGLNLEDGFIQADAIAYADSKDKSIIGIEIHSGRNRIVRRIFEHLRYDVRNLDRVFFAGLTKKNVDRSKWRFLTEREVRALKFLNASYHKRSAHKEKMAEADAIEMEDRKRKNPLLFEDILDDNENEDFTSDSNTGDEFSGIKETKKFRKTKPRVNTSLDASAAPKKHRKTKPRLGNDFFPSSDSRSFSKPKPRSDREFSSSSDSRSFSKPKLNRDKDFSSTSDSRSFSKPKLSRDKDFSSTSESRSFSKPKPSRDKDYSSSSESRSFSKPTLRGDKDASKSSHFDKKSKSNSTRGSSNDNNARKSFTNNRRKD
jgi:23S rRNA pseudouridine2605 synthase